MSYITNAVPLVRSEDIDTVWHGIDHAEGIAVAADGTIWCGGEDGDVYAGRLDADPAAVGRLHGRTLGLATDARGNAFCADMTRPGIYRVARAGVVSLVSDGSAERPARVPNHPAFLADGTLLFTDSGEWGSDDGCIFAVSADGATHVADETARRFPNGLAVRPDGLAIAVVESRLPGVSELSIGAGRHLGDRRVLVETPGAIPDGVAYDAAGRLLVSCWAPDAILLWEPGGKARVLAHDPTRFVLNQPTNIAFLPGSSRVVVANIGERFLSTFEHLAPGGPVFRPEFNCAGQEP